MRFRYLIEGRKEFVAKFGPERLDQYLAIKDKIPPSAQKYKDMDYVLKYASPEQLDKFLSFFSSYYKSDSQIRKDKKKVADQGTKLIDIRNGWKIYWIQTFESSNYHGRGTKWCISGDKRYKDGSYPRDHFRQYKMYGNTYFYIKGNRKIAVFIYESGKPGLFEIYDETDSFLCNNDLPTDFPDMRDVIPNAPKGYLPTGPECAKESFKTFGQGRGTLAMSLDWFKTGEIKPKEGFFECLQVFLDNGYHIENRHNDYIYVSNRDCGGTHISYEEFLEISQFDEELARQRFKYYDEYENGEDNEPKQRNPMADVYPTDEFFNYEDYFNDERDEKKQANKNPLAIFYSQKDDAYIFPLDRGVEINMDQMDKIEELMDQGYEFCDASEQGMGYVLTSDQRILDRLDELTYTEFLREFG